MRGTWSYYKAETGLFVGVVYSGPVGSEETNAPEGCVPIAGRHDQLCKRVDVATGAVVDYQPPQPSKHHAWDGRRWRLTAEAQQAQAAEANALVALAAADQRRIRALSDLALKVDGATSRLESIEAECQQHRARLSAARSALK